MLTMQMFQEENFPVRLSKDVSSVVLVFLFIHYLRKVLYHWEKTYASVVTFLMAKRVWEILIPQICMDFHDWENRTCSRKLLLNLFQTSENNK